MEILKAVILGIVQGLTEFLPVSSSGHLVLVPWLLGWESPGLLFDTLVHWGTLAAVLAYFWRDWRRILGAWVRGLVRRDRREPDARLMWLLVLGTLPAVVMGYLLEAQFEALFARPVWVSAFLLVTAAWLTLAERLARRSRKVEGMRWDDALIIGFSQAVAIVPGISRSGATIATGLMRGFDRPDAARFSFLLSTPVILGAGLFKIMEATSVPSAARDVLALLAGFLVAGVTGYLAIGLLLRYLQRRRLYAFALYCALAGVSCLTVAWLR